MRDGVILRADIYRPNTPERLPALLSRTPYCKNPGRDDTARRLAAHGYVVVIQDTRGRYMSDGVARPHDEGEDGYDTIEWVATLPSVNGRVGTFGGSYSATTQLMAAPLRPPHLVAMFPSSSYNSRYDMVFQGGAFYLADGLSWNLGQGADVRRRLVHPEADRDGPIGMNETERQMFANRWIWHVPLKTVDAMEVQRYSPAYFEMLSHPSYDEYWKRFDIEARHAAVRGPRLPFHRLVRHAPEWDAAQLHGSANERGHRARAVGPAPGRRAVDPLQADAAIDDDWRRRLRPTRRVRSRACHVRLVRLLVERPSDQCPLARPGPAVRDGGQRLA